MKILFICGSIEPGKDGVGDYTRRLCGELIKTGHQTQILSICDVHSNVFSIDNQEVEGIKIVVNRIPVATSFSARYNLAHKTINNFEPDRISLQYVPYGFNPKGLPFWLPYFLKKLKGNHKWHIMFHELWIGIDIESSYRHKCIGRLQQIIVKKIVYTTKAQFIHTQNKLYQFFLQYHNINAEVMPIFGNIPLTSVKNKVKEFTQFILFGTIHHGAPFSDFISDLVNYKSKFNRPIKFIFVGKNGPELSNYVRTLENSSIQYEIVGIQTENIISQLLIDSDYGISTTPYFQTEKSGVFAAYKEHQVNTICVSRSWTPSRGKYTIPNIIKYEENNLTLFPMKNEVFNISSLASQFIKSISIT